MRPKIKVVGGRGPQGRNLPATCKNQSTFRRNFPAHCTAARILLLRPVAASFALSRPRVATGIGICRLGGGGGFCPHRRRYAREDAGATSQRTVDLKTSPFRTVIGNGHADFRDPTNRRGKAMRVVRPARYRGQPGNRDDHRGGVACTILRRRGGCHPSDLRSRRQTSGRATDTAETARPLNFESVRTDPIHIVSSDALRESIISQQPIQSGNDRNFIEMSY